MTCYSSSCLFVCLLFVCLFVCLFLEACFACVNSRQFYPWLS